MTLPRFRSAKGEFTELTWTRLKPAAEVSAEVPSAPDIQYRKGLVVQEARREVEGSGFDRATVVTMTVLDDNGIYRIGQKEVNGRPLLGGYTLSYDADRAWMSAELPAALDQARSILEEHDFPAHLGWPEPGAWAWSGGDLFWAVTPGERMAGTLVFADGREEDAGMAAARRGGLGWPDTSSEADERAERLWPRFSAFGWAIELHDAMTFSETALSSLERWRVAALQAGARRGAGGALGFLEAAVRALTGGDSREATEDLKRSSEAIRQAWDARDDGALSKAEASARGMLLSRAQQAPRAENPEDAQSVSSEAAAALVEHLPLLVSLAATAGEQAWKSDGDDRLREHIERDAHTLRSISFTLGAHMAEARLRKLHEDGVLRAEREQEAKSRAGTQTSAARRQARAERRAIAVNLAIARLEGAPPRGKAWSLASLAEEVWSSWKLESPPPLRSVQELLKEAVSAGELVLPSPG